MLDRCLRRGLNVNPTLDRTYSIFWGAICRKCCDAPGQTNSASGRKCHPFFHFCPFHINTCAMNKGTSAVFFTQQSDEHVLRYICIDR